MFTLAKIALLGLPPGLSAERGLSLAEGTVDSSTSPPTGLGDFAANEHLLLASSSPLTLLLLSLRIIEDTVTLVVKHR